jgi:hypothetical protein
MAADIFRFVTVRAPQRHDAEGASAPVAIYALAGAETALLGELRAIASRGEGRPGLASRARQHLAQTGPLARLDDLPLPLSRFECWISSRESASRGELVRAIEDNLGAAPDALIAGEQLRAAAARVGDSLLAGALAVARGHETDRLLLAARLLGLVDHASKLTGDVVVSLRLSLRRSVVLPAEIFVSWGQTPPSVASYKQRVEQVRAQKQRVGAGLHGLTALTLAIGELRGLVRRGLLGTRTGVAAAPAFVGPSTAVGPAGHEEPLIVGHLGEAESTAVMPQLSEAGRRVLTEHGFDADILGTVAVMNRLELERHELATGLFTVDGNPWVAPLGPSWAGGVTGMAPTRAQPEFSAGQLPGACPPEEPESPLVDGPTIPTGVGAVQPLGVADLMVARQRLVRYEAGEIAHIENVLQSELKERVHRRSVLREEELVREEEVTRETNSDLATSERFELQREAERIFSEETQFETAASGGGSLGPFSGEASVRFARNTAREDAIRSATSFAREVTRRSATRIQTRTLEHRRVRTVTETEETNTHRLNNETGTDHVVGVYRWVDAIFEAQVVNYGRRLLLDILVPEPSAFWHHARAIAPLEGLKVEKPFPPGFCVIDSDEFVPLAPGLINETNYSYFVGKYRPKDVAPPPPQFRLIATTLEQAFGSGAGAGTVKTQETLKVPDGCIARRAILRGAYIHSGSPQLGIYIGRRHIPSPSGEVDLDGENDLVPLSLVAAGVRGYAFNIEVVCERSPEAYAAWQHDVYSAIMTAYEEQRSVYEQELERRRQTSGTVEALASPSAKRQIVERELHRGALGILGGHHFEAFDAVRRAVAPHGYPEIDLAEAEAEAPYVQFFEEAFDWRNLTYRFYPYAWARKETWPMLATLEDPDPVFASFLRAGAARLRLPVSPGFEEAVTHYFETGGHIPDSDDVPHIDDDFYQSLVGEVVSARGEDAVPGVGTVDVVGGSTAVVGHATGFTADDERREIYIDGARYVIAHVVPPEAIELDRPFEGATAAQLPYSVGVKLVGSAWEVRVPTALVTLRPEATGGES